ncbi:unnamed protein product, partial [marine sediment metagenome]
MKQLIILIIILIILSLSSTSVYAAEFSPAPLKLSAPGIIKYNFDGTKLVIPVKVSGTNALSVFCVYTKDKASDISNVMNGYLGWHHVNKVDTSIYISPITQLSVGNNEIRWSGKDDDGNAVPKGEYTKGEF